VVQDAVLGGRALYHYLGRAHQDIRSTFYFCGSEGREGSRVTHFGAGNMTVSTFKDKFINLSYFIDMFQTKEWKAWMFERGFWPQFRRFMISLRLHTLNEVVDSMRALELESAASQKSQNMTSRYVASVEEKRKGNRPFTSLDREDLANRGTQLLAITAGYRAIWLDNVVSLEMNLVGMEGEATGKAMDSFS